MNIPNIMALYKAGMTQNIISEWRPIIFEKDLMPKLSNALIGLDTYLHGRGVTMAHIKKYGVDKFIRPFHTKIFAPFSYFEPNDLKMIIVGQDPYPNEDSNGIAFSTNGRSSLAIKSIYECLLRSKIIKEIPSSGNLEHWAENGVLLINRNMTRSPDWEIDGDNVTFTGEGNSDKKFMHQFWNEYTDQLIYNITNTVKHNIVVLLWGNNAHGVPVSTNGNVLCIKTRHPTEYTLKKDNPNHFVNSDQFILAQKHLGGFDWTVKISESSNSIIMSSDGGCSNNGKPDAIGSFAAYFPKKFNNIDNPIKPCCIYGLVNDYELKMTNGLALKETTERISHTNNRGELLGTIHGLIYILEQYKINRVKYPIFFVADSEYTMKYVCWRLWKREKEDPKLSGIKVNRDLCLILLKLLKKIARIVPEKQLIHPNQMSENPTAPPKDWRGMTVMYQEAHMKAADIQNLKTGGNQFLIDKQGLNETADFYCNLAIKNKNTKTIVNL